MPIAREIPEDLIADDAFWSQTELTPSGCIEWKGSRDAYGYGRVFARGAEFFMRLAEIGGQIPGLVDKIDQVLSDHAANRIGH